MPLILDEREVARWLAEPDPALIRPAPDGTLIAREVSARVNSVENDDPACLAPARAVEQLRLV
jgi:putative SOS response-associated peptidase YedK